MESLAVKIPAAGAYALVVSLLAFAPLGAAGLGGFNFPVVGSHLDPDPNPAFAPHSVANGLTFSHISNPPTISTFFTAGHNYGGNIVLTTNNPGATSVGSAYPGDSYFSFTVTPAAGYSIDFAELTFKAATAESEGTHGFFVTTSVNDDILGHTVIPSTRPILTPFAVDLSFLSGIADTIEFRVYSYAPQFNYHIDYDDLMLTGTVIPEPSTYAVILGLIVFGGALRWRRSRDAVRGQRRVPMCAFACRQAARGARSP